MSEERVAVEICDTTGFHGAASLRAACIARADVLALCYAVDDPASLVSLKTKASVRAPRPGGRT